MEEKKTDTLVVRINFTYFGSEDVNEVRTRIFADLCAADFPPESVQGSEYNVNWFEIVHSER